ncbi:MAG: hypothetical protein OXC55_02495 [Chloroflexi bacterium]|nr:hypothetical protein [Chloroflexota bacterium]
MSGQLYVEAFGKLEKDDDLAARILEDGREEPFLNVFEDQAEILGWSTGWSNKAGSRPEPLWGAHEAELTTAGDGDDSIGFINVNVGFGPPVPSEPTLPPPPGGKHYANLGWHRRSWDPAPVLPPLIQCFHDSLSQFGKVELTGIQVFGLDLDPRMERFTAAPNWFSIGSAQRTEAIIAFDAGLFGVHADPSMITERLTIKNGQFRLGPMVDLPEEYALRRIEQWPFLSVSPYEKGLAASLPEWSPSAIGYALGMVSHLAAEIDPTPANFVLRITRVPLDPSS